METLTINPQNTAFQASSKLRLNWNARLTDTEDTVGRQVIYGYTQEEAATILHKSPFTITNTIRRIYKKTGARNITELSAWLWCKDFHVIMIISEGKRKVIAMLFLLLFAISEVCTLSINARTIRTRPRARTASSVKAARGRKNELDYYIDYLIEL